MQFMIQISTLQRLPPGLSNPDVLTHVLTKESRTQPLIKKLTTVAHSAVTRGQGSGHSQSFSYRLSSANLLLNWIMALIENAAETSRSQLTFHA